MKYFLIAGEASGDLHGANLMKQIKKQDSEAVFRFIGGDLMQKQGGEPLKHYKEMAFMGIWEVLLNIRTISKNMKTCQKEILRFTPDAIILIDYAGFNLRIAKFAKQFEYKVFYYISPKVWAWKKSRVKKIKRYVDKMFVILPFEVDFYKQFNYPVMFIGNPLVDAIEEKKEQIPDYETFINTNNLSKKPIIALLSGSRKQEIARLLPPMLQQIKHFPDYQFVLAAVPSIDISFYQQFTSGFPVKILVDKTYSILKHAEAAIVTSGTATLETAILNVPEVVCYKTGPITYHIGKHLVNVPFFSLVNLIMEQEVVKELLQFNLEEEIRQELNKLLFDKEYRKNLLENYAKLREKLGKTGASQRTAKAIVGELTKQ